MGNWEELNKERWLQVCHGRGRGHDVVIIGRDMS